MLGKRFWLGSNVSIKIPPLFFTSRQTWMLRCVNILLGLCIYPLPYVLGCAVPRNIVTHNYYSHLFISSLYYYKRIDGIQNPAIFIFVRITRYYCWKFEDLKIFHCGGIKKYIVLNRPMIDRLCLC